MDSVNKAIKGYTEALSIDSTYGMSYFDRATAKQKIKDYKGSIEDYKKAIKYNFNTAWSYNGIGYSLLSLNNMKGALSNFDKAIEIMPDYAAAYHNRAVLIFIEKF